MNDTKMIPCEACNRDWGHGYCGVCKGVGMIRVAANAPIHSVPPSSPNEPPRSLEIEVAYQQGWENGRKSMLDECLEELEEMQSDYFAYDEEYFTLGAAIIRLRAFLKPEEQPK